jgi:hypothetical protein
MDDFDDAVNRFRLLLLFSSPLLLLVASAEVAKGPSDAHFSPHTGIRLSGYRIENRRKDEGGDPSITRKPAYSAIPRQAPVAEIHHSRPKSTARLAMFEQGVGALGARFQSVHMARHSQRGNTI